MRRTWILLLALGCSKTTPTEPPPATPTSLADLIPAAATGISRFAPDHFPMATLVGTELHAREAACWIALEAKLRATYQVELGARHTSVVLLEGDLPRPDVEACVVEALSTALGKVEITPEGELTRLVVPPLGTVYAAWRGSFVIAGSRDDVTAALAGPGAGSPWRERVTTLPAGPMAIASTDQLFGSLLGVPSSGWDLVLDELSHQPEPVRISGHLVVYCASAADAATAAQRVAAGDFRFVVPLPPSLVEALKRLHVTVRGAAVELAFDASTWDGVDWDTMSQLATSLEAAMPAP